MREEGEVGMIHPERRRENLKKIEEMDNMVEVVRCKDCVNFIWNSISQNAGSCGIGIGTPPNYRHSKDWFCANGKQEGR